ncbi:MAG TPA: hypothetical protein VLA97_15420, partial [Nocardioidaceae bacterium]|nr:hypothetical protein [Nocardioidaceae bacterium]
MTQAGATPPEGESRGLEVYVGRVDASDLEKLKLVGLDHEDIATGRARDGKLAVEVVMNNLQAEKLAAQGVALDVKKIDGVKASRVAAK